MRIRLRAMAVKLSGAEQRLQKILERAAAAKNAGLHGAYTALENFRDFLIAETFEVAQNHGAAKDIGNLLQGAAHCYLNFNGGKLLERCSAMIFDFHVRVPFFRLGIDGNVFLQMPLEPALVVQRFANGDAIEPGLQGAALAKIANAAKGLQENFLGAISRVRSVAQHAEDEVIDRRMIVGDEPVECRLRAS